MNTPQPNQPNVDQQAAADQFLQFLLAPNEKEFSISGPAGTGKTFLLQYLIDKTIPQYKDACQLLGIKPNLDAVALTATTNKAADVLGGHFAQKAQTVHSFMNLKVRDDLKTGKQILTKTNKFTIHRNLVIFIDEASMIPRDLDKIIQEATHSSCKIVYVGDDRQLAPVGEKISVVFSRPMRRVYLTIPMRNSGQPALMALCQQMRDTVETGVFKPIPLVQGVVEQLSDAEMEYHVNTYFLDEGYNSRILGYTNNQVKAYNEHIRGIRGYGDRLNDGELVVNNTAIEMGSKGMLHAEAEFIVKRIDAPDGIFEVDGFEIAYYPIELYRTPGSEPYIVFQPVNPTFYQEVIRYLGREHKWGDYFRLKNNFPDLRSRDSSTVYKAQGSTFDSVYVDLQNIGTCNISDQVARMLYVAVSRPRSRIFFYGTLPDKYLGG